MTTVSWTYKMKYFEEQMNELNVDYDGINTMEKFASTTTDITLKIITHRDLQFMFWMQDCKAT